MVWLAKGEGEKEEGRRWTHSKARWMCPQCRGEAGLKSGARGSVPEPVSWGSILKQWHWGFDFFLLLGVPKCFMDGERLKPGSLWPQAGGWVRIPQWKAGESCAFFHSHGSYGAVSLQWWQGGPETAVTWSPASPPNRAQSHQNKAWFWLLLGKTRRMEYKERESFCFCFLNFHCVTRLYYQCHHFCLHLLRKGETDIYWAPSVV